jgi:hypothetical protein
MTTWHGYIDSINDDTFFCIVKTNGELGRPNIEMEIPLHYVERSTIQEGQAIEVAILDVLSGKISVKLCESVLTEENLRLAKEEGERLATMIKVI